MALLVGASGVLAAEEKPLTPIEARKKVGETIIVEMTVRAAKDRLEKRGEIYLDASPVFVMRRMSLSSSRKPEQHLSSWRGHKCAMALDR